jgi:glycosyltransferase involved in cell wall biosynthesis
MRTAVVHDWLYTYGGSERVLESILRCFPVEIIYTLVDFLPENKRFYLNNVLVNCSFLQHMPWVRALRRHYLPLMPLAIESFDVSSFDIVISSSSSIAKGILTNSEQLHICYCHSPARYFWDLTHQYLQGANLDSGVKGFIASMIFHYLRIWDVSNTNRVDYFIANSRYVARRIWHIFRRESTVIYPPIDVDKFNLESNKDDFYFTVSRLESYKKVDLIVETFARLKKKLVVVGFGRELEKIKAKATPNIEILGCQPHEVVQDLMQRARAFIFAANEDFGIVNLEAQASGTPVIAFGRGGALETVHGVFPGTKPESGTTGIFFREQTSASLLEALHWFEMHRDDIDPGDCRGNAERFSRPRFEREFKHFVETKWEEFRATRWRI